MHLKRRGDGKYICLSTHLNKKRPFKAWKGTWQASYWERPDSPMCKGTDATWVALRVPCGASLRCKESPVSPHIKRISRHLCISVLPYDSREGSLGEGKAGGKPLVSSNSCCVPGGSSQQKCCERAVRQQLWESACIANWEGDWGTDKLVVFLGVWGLLPDWTAWGVHICLSQNK